MKPLDFIGQKVKYDPDGQVFWGISDQRKQANHILSLRGWGTIKHLFTNQSEAAKFQDELGKWLEDAINEKIERER